MRLVIDAQLLQIEIKNKENNYISFIFEKIVKEKNDFDVILVLNGYFKESVELVRALFEGVIPQKNIVVFDILHNEESFKFDQINKEILINNSIRDKFIDSLNPDVFLDFFSLQTFSNDLISGDPSFQHFYPVCFFLLDTSILVGTQNQFNNNSNHLFEEYIFNKSSQMKSSSFVFTLNQKNDIFNSVHDFPYNKTLNLETSKAANSTNLSSSFSIEAFWPQILHISGMLKRCNVLDSKPRLAFVSPMPPEKSGISDYSSLLIRHLIRYYDIEVIVDQKYVEDYWVIANCKIRSYEWFVENGANFDRILYQVGNSNLHFFIIKLIQMYPGVVVLHDFFLGHLTMSCTEPALNNLNDSIYLNAGYTGLIEKLKQGLDHFIWNNPLNFEFIKSALSVIVHSEHSRSLAKAFYRPEITSKFYLIPLMRSKPEILNKIEARKSLNLGNGFIVCCFGVLGKTKLNDQVLKGWLESQLSKNINNKLIFVGDSPPGDYSDIFTKQIHNLEKNNQIIVTGFVTKDQYEAYLCSADMAVQLRSQSRGETSAAVLDCLNFKISTIINAHGSMQEIPDNCVYKINDNFEIKELTNAIDELSTNNDLRLSIAQKGFERLSTEHSPDSCADLYLEVIEKAYLSGSSAYKRLIESINLKTIDGFSKQELNLLSQSIAQNFPYLTCKPQLFLDISEVHHNDLRTGIQRVVRSILNEILTKPVDGFRIEPVYARVGQPYRYARKFTMNFIGYPEYANDVVDEIIEFNAGDKFIGLDLCHHITVGKNNFYQKMRSYGVSVKFLVYDLLPILLPKAFPSIAVEYHQKWLEVLAEMDGVICISESVANEFRTWLSSNTLKVRKRSIQVDWFHLGADIGASSPTLGVPSNVKEQLNLMKSRNSFLLVGTVEPRKGQRQSLEAFEILWRDGFDVSLVIVGKEGWMMDDLIQRIIKHSEFGQRLFWYKSVSDEFLELLYSSSTCLIAASEGEGFGLPLIEAAQHKLPIIARDLPVFREVAGKNAYFFAGKEPEVIASAVRNWLGLYENANHPRSEMMDWFTWNESTECFKKIIEKDDLLM